jgi:hypothetical protein
MRMKRIFRSLMALCIPLIFSANAFALPVTWSTNGHMYDVVTLANADWNSARTNAQGLGPNWDLATITSPDEQAFINNLLGLPPSAGIVQYWVGGFQPIGADEPGGSWQWINGEDLFWDDTGVLTGAIPGVYSNWGTGEPNNVGGQNHVALDNRYGWGWDDNDSQLNGIIRGYVAENVPEPSTMAMLLLGAGMVGLAAYRRKRQS